MREILGAKENVSVIIPAFNEGRTVGNVVRTALGHPSVGEVLVIDDGSRDNTVAFSREAGAKVLAHSKNLGKAAAMDTGVRKSSGGIIFFIDADIVGLTHEMMSAAISGVQDDGADMYVLITDHGAFFPESFIKSLPLIAGLRVMRKSVWHSVPKKYMKRFGIELALNFFAKKAGARVEARTFKGLRQVVKEKKRGLIWGLYQRMFMIRDLIVAWVRLYIGYNVREWVRGFRGKLSLLLSIRDKKRQV